MIPIRKLDSLKAFYHVVIVFDVLAIFLGLPITGITFSTLLELLLIKSISTPGYILGYLAIYFLSAFIVNSILYSTVNGITRRIRIHHREALIATKRKSFELSMAFIGVVLFGIIAVIALLKTGITNDQEQLLVLSIITIFVGGLFLLNRGLFRKSGILLNTLTDEKTSFKRISSLPIVLFLISWIPVASSTYIEDGPIGAILFLYFGLLYTTMLITTLICSVKIVRLIKRIQNNLKAIDKQIENLNNQ